MEKNAIFVMDFKSFLQKNQLLRAYVLINYHSVSFFKVFYHLNQIQELLLINCLTNFQKQNKEINKRDLLIIKVFMFCFFLSERKKYSIENAELYIN